MKNKKDFNGTYNIKKEPNKNLMQKIAQIENQNLYKKLNFEIEFFLLSLINYIFWFFLSI